MEVFKMSKMRDRGAEWGNVGGVFSTFATYQQGNYAAYRKILVCQVKNDRSLKKMLVKLKDADHKDNYLSS